MTTSPIQDVASALILAEHRPTGEPANQLRTRLRSRIRHVIEPAARYAEAMPDGRARDIATDTVRYARRLSTRTEFRDPAAELRLLAKSLETLSRYAAAADAPDDAKHQRAAE
ncbi:hypothetical protein [Streptomyces apocyni]|uniref:hypothetical protein n=1 Tax=Streptomyces apocyni TaxID=2654677 RepID=UPI0012E9C4FB|nr:hypothetical protein [Streptomyces apocyni]